MSSCNTSVIVNFGCTVSDENETELSKTVIKKYPQCHRKPCSASQNRAANILELVLTNILEGDAEPAETALRIFLHAARHVDTAGFRQLLQPGRYIDSVTMDACAFDNIADIDPHPEFDPPICRNLRIPLGHPGAVEDVAEAVGYLASDAAKHVTGQTLHVNGGRIMT